MPTDSETNKSDNHPILASLVGCTIVKIGDEEDWGAELVLDDGRTIRFSGFDDGLTVSVNPYR